MHACGVIVEYNPFHNGHLYHLQKTKELTKADCIIAVMSGSFLQRGEPAIIDKFHRTKAALAGGADIVIELPYAYAVQSSELFAKGALLSLHALGASSICFGSEVGKIDPFLRTITMINENQSLFDQTIRMYLKKGFSYPKANTEALKTIGIHEMDLMKPNNILGYSYVKTIVQHQLPINPYTIQRIHNDYHEQKITHSIASATSIRHELTNYTLTEKIHQSMPDFSIEQLIQYEHTSDTWHTWSQYYPYLVYQFMSLSKEELAQIHGMDEGLENRLKRTILTASTFDEFIHEVQTKRYTFTRLQRILTHVLTNTKKSDILPIVDRPTVPYIRLLGLSQTGQRYVKQQKDEMNIPIISNLNKKFSRVTYLDEKTTHIYYSILPFEKRQQLFRQEFQLPIRLDA